MALPGAETQPLIALGLPQYTAALAAFAWFASVIYRRKRLSRGQLAWRLAAIAALAVFATGITEGLPSIEEILADVSQALGRWTYLLVGVMAFLETGAFVGLIAPGEAAVVVGGVVAGQGDISLTLLIGIVWMAAYLGDTVSFFVGRRLGREFLLKHGARVQITPDRLAQVERYMDAHGGKTIVVGRFIGLVRALAPFIAGASKMSYRSFAPYDVIGAGLWATAFCLLGYAFSQNLEAVIHYVGQGVLIFGWTVGTIVLTVYLVRRFRRPEERAKLGRWLDEQETHPARRRVIRPLRLAWRKVVVPIVMFFSPQVRFAIDRFTPGRLGLEFTTAASFVAVASFGFYFFTDFAAYGTNADLLNHLNESAFDVASRLQTAWLDSLAKAVTNVGALYVVAPVALLAAILCGWRRRFVEAAVLIVSLALTVVAVQLTKSFADVPRPSGSLVPTEGSSYPSGHTAYAVAYVTIAIALERIGGMFGRIVFVLSGIGLVVAVGLSRVYLRAHYLTDVIGGAALGFLVAASVTCVALLYMFLRDYGQARRSGTAGKLTSERIE